MKKVSSIVPKEGQHLLFVNGQQLPALAYITYLTDRNRYRDFADAGYRLFSFPVFFAHQPLNESSGLQVFTKGIFDEEIPDFSQFDEDMDLLLQACPGAYIFPRVNVSVPKRWEQAHPEELNYTGMLRRPGSQRRACFSSDAWAQEVKDELKLFIDHIQSMPWKDHIIGYQIAGGNTEEWFPFDGQGSVGKPSEDAFALHIAKTGIAGTQAEYMAFLSEVTAQRLCEFSRYVKELTEQRYLVGCFYGYTFSCPNTNSNHHALRRVLECKDIDFLCSPISYDHARKAGMDHLYMLPVDSVKLHGKLYFSENDTRTHLSRPVNDTPWYTQPVWFGPDTEQGSLEILKMHYARMLLKGHAGWWFDMWGGWFDSPGYLAFMKKALLLSENAMKKPMASVAQVAVFADEKAYCKAEDDALSRRICATLHTIGTAGVPYDLFLAEDLPLVELRKYKAIILLEPAVTEASSAVADCGLPVIRINKDTLGISTEQLRQFYNTSGVHLYSPEDAVIYANESYLFVHTVHDGQQVLSLPEDCTLTDAFTGEPFPPTFYADTGKSFLLEKIFHA